MDFLMLKVFVIIQIEKRGWRPRTELLTRPSLEFVEIVFIALVVYSFLSSVIQRNASLSIISLLHPDCCNWDIKTCIRTKSYRGDSSFSQSSSAYLEQPPTYFSFSLDADQRRQFFFSLWTRTPKIAQSGKYADHDHSSRNCDEYPGCAVDGRNTSSWHRTSDNLTIERGNCVRSTLIIIYTFPFFSVFQFKSCFFLAEGFSQQSRSFSSIK